MAVSFVQANSYLHNGGDQLKLGLLLMLMFLPSDGRWAVRGHPLARNAVGLSRGSVQTVAWAYQAPGAPSGVQVAPVLTSGAGGVARMEG